MIEYINIGKVRIAKTAGLAPMAGVCNSAFRKIIKEMGCGLIYAEMVSDKAISYDNQKTMNNNYSLSFTTLPYGSILYSKNLGVNSLCSNSFNILRIKTVRVLFSLEKSCNDLFDTVFRSFMP